MQHTGDWIRNIYSLLQDELGREHPYNAASACVQTAIAPLFSHIANDECQGSFDAVAMDISIQWLSTPGKGSRILLTNGIFESCAMPPDDKTPTTLQFVRTVCAIVEAAHNLSLIVDDCIDGDLTRRNRETVFKQAGRAGVQSVATIFVDLLFRLVWSLPLDDDKKAVCAEIIVGHSRSLSGAIHKELKWESSTGADIHAGLIDEVTQTYVAKSVGVIEMGVALLRVASNLDETLLPWLMSYINNIGLFLQSINDVENYSSRKSCGAFNTDRFGDIRKRRLTLLLLHQVERRDVVFLKLFEEAFQTDRTDQCVKNLAYHLINSGVIASEITRLSAERNGLRSQLFASMRLDREFKEQADLVLDRYYAQLSLYSFSPIVI